MIVQKVVGLKRCHLLRETEATPRIHLPIHMLPPPVAEMELKEQKKTKKKQKTRKPLFTVVL